MVIDFTPSLCFFGWGLLLVLLVSGVGIIACLSSEERTAPAWVEIRDFVRSLRAPDGRPRRSRRHSHHDPLSFAPRVQKIALPLSYNIRSLYVRRKMTALAVGGIALVIAVLIVLIAMANGFRVALSAIGSTANAIVTHRGSNSELTSSIGRDSAQTLTDDARVARDENCARRLADGVYRPAGHHGDRRPELSTRAVRSNGRPSGLRADGRHGDWPLVQAATTRLEDRRCLRRRGLVVVPYEGRQLARRGLVATTRESPAVGFSSGGCCNVPRMSDAFGKAGTKPKGDEVDDLTSAGLTFTNPLRRTTPAS